MDREEKRRKRKGGTLRLPSKGPAVLPMMMFAKVVERYKGKDVQLHNIMSGYRKNILVWKRKKFKPESDSKEPAAATAGRTFPEAADGGARPVLCSKAFSVTTGHIDVPALQGPPTLDVNLLEYVVPNLR